MRVDFESHETQMASWAEYCETAEEFLDCS
jgi:hypothetical protein